MTNFYTDRQEAKRDRLEAAAEKAMVEAKSRLDRAHQMAQMIPLGQPILVDHYSAPRHRSHLRKIDTNYRMGFEAQNRAVDLEEKAEGLGTHGVASDDPDAVVKLREKLAELEAKQDRMKAANTVIRKHAKGGPEAQRDALIAAGWSEGPATRLVDPTQFGGPGFPRYALTNNNANIRRYKQRIEQLATLVLDDDTWAREGVAPDGTGWTMELTEGRYLLTLSARCDDTVRAVIRSHGFVWAPSRKAWTRKVTANAAQAAQRLAVALTAGQPA